MKWLRLLCLLAFLSAGLLAQSPTVGSGSPSDAIQQQFVQAYYRNGFYLLVQPTPVADVRKLGSTGLVQEFTSVASSSQRLALVKPNLSSTVTEGVPGVFQMLAAMYTYFNSVGVNTAGYPTMDTQNCPQLTDNTCTYQLFDKPYALFVYSRATLNGQNFAVRNPYYTKWTTFGGVAVFGPAASAETAVTSSFNTTATYQTFQAGAIYNITSGTLNTRLVAVQQPVWDVYNQNGGPTGTLGLPAGDPLLLPNGNKRQTFEGGAVDFAPSGAAVLRMPVASIVVRAPAQPIRMNLGDSVTLQASTFTSAGTQVTDRDITWATTNGRVATVDAKGATVTVKATGGGTAYISASSEGKSSQPIQVFVTAPCCQVGEGAPTTVVEQAFLDTVTRHRLNLKLPTPAAVRRVGLGYIQEFTDATGARLVIALSDRSPIANVLMGAILAKYDTLGGPAGSLGYPASDVTAGGRQLFENSAALAGTPVRLVSGPVLAKWAVLSYEAGIAGSPNGDVSTFATFSGASGIAQSFQNGAIYAITGGGQAGKSYFSGGLIFAKYSALGGPSGKYGAAITDEYGIGGKRRQEFEGGIIEFAPGDSQATATDAKRQPAATASPGAVIAGTRVRITLGGFDDGATLQVSVTGRPDFTVNTANGSYVWDIYIPSSATSGTVSIHARDTASGAAADTSYTVRSPRELPLKVVLVRGDAQSAVPGALLPLPLRVAVRDQAGNGVAGISVRFASSPGSQITPASAVTDDRGEAEARLRLAPREGVSVATAEALGQVLTFSARAATMSLPQFPKVTQTADAGALLASAAGILRFHQLRGELPSPNGPADGSALGQFLKTACVLDMHATQICDGYLFGSGGQDPVANLWRIAGFVNGGVDVSIEPPDEASVRDAMNQGSPVLLALSLTSGGSPAGSHFVVATGIDSDGAILIQDPSPLFSRTKLSDYQGSFSAGGQDWTASLSAAIRLLPRTPQGGGFLAAASNAQIAVNSIAGPCGASAQWTWPAVSAAPATAVSTIRFSFCDGAQAQYQVDLGGAGIQPATVGRTEGANRGRANSAASGGGTDDRFLSSAFAWASTPPGRQATQNDGLPHQAEPPQATNIPAQSSTAAPVGEYQAVITDLGSPASRYDVSGFGATSYKMTRPAAQWVLAPQETSLPAGGVVNAASFTTDIAPGGLAAIFGTGLARAGGTTAVDVDGTPGKVVAASPFQVNAQIPAGIPAGQHSLRLISPYGSADMAVEVKDVAPALFQLAGGRVAGLNQDGKVNTPLNPLMRGQVLVLFGTGLGAVSPQGSLMTANTAVTVVVSGRELPAAFAGLTPGFAGLYQINVVVPVAAAPGLDLPVTVRQAGIESNSVLVAIQ